MRRNFILSALCATSLLSSAALPLTACAAPESGTEIAIEQSDRALARDILEEILKLRTAKGFGQTEAQANALADRLLAAGFTEDQIDIPTTTIDGETVASFLVRYPGKEGGKNAPIALIAHMDVVDASADTWNTDPYEPVEKDGYLYARGAVDNKAGIALLVATFIRLKQQGFEPDRDLVIAFSGDEETGMTTTRKLTAHPWVKGAEYALNSDAGVGSIDADGKNPSYSIQSAEKTYATFHITAKNAGGHSSAPRDDNALFDIAEAINAVRGLTFPIGFNDITRQMAKDLADAEGGEFESAINTLLETPEDAEARTIVEASSVSTHFLYTTCVPTMLSSGSAENALPQRATLTVNCRILPGTAVATVEEALTAAIDNDNINIELLGEPLESPVSPINEPLFASLRNAVHTIYPSAPVKPSMSSGGTDGKEFRAAGIPTYGAGAITLVRPEDFRAHGNDERLPLESFYDQLVFWEVLLKDLAGGNEE
ncbi:MAG: M20/M25/M40 family metallo-hydrolase [Pseudomonadota bacterium]|nr:M20/M25/M40 family metallo-hydrolase [Pseudomonadota bacterium]